MKEGSCTPRHHRRLDVDALDVGTSCLKHELVAAHEAQLVVRLLPTCTLEIQHGPRHRRLCHLLECEPGHAAQLLHIKFHLAALRVGTSATAGVQAILVQFRDQAAAEHP